MAKKKNTGGATISKKKSQKGGASHTKKVPLKKESGRKYGSAFQHGPWYYHQSPQGRTYDQYGCQVFRDSEEQTVEEDSKEILLAELQRQEQEGEAGELEGEEETEELEIEWLAEAQKKVMEEVRAQNLELVQKCHDQATKIKASSARGGAAPMSASSIKVSQKLRVQKKAQESQQQQQGESQRKPHRYRLGT